MPDQSIFPREQRAQHRIHGVFPVRVRGVTSGGQPFETHTLADNISSGGLYLQLPRLLPHGARLFTLTRLPGGARLAARGRVLRAESKEHELSGLAVRFSRSRLLPRAAT